MNLHEPKTAKVLGFFLSENNPFYLLKLIVFFFLLSALFFSTINAQSNVSIRGQVLEIEKGYPLPNVLIQVEGVLHSTYSNEDGYFKLENIQLGNYSVKFILVGYETNTINNIIITEDVATQLLVKLKRKILQGETISVEAEQIENTTEIGGDIIVINVEDEKKIGNNNLKKILQQVAGLEVVSTGTGENNATISIHGSNANQVLVLLDGSRLNNPQTGDVALSEIPFNEVEKIEVVRHGNTAMYGSGAYAGVVHFKTSQKVESAYASIESKAGSFSTYTGKMAGGMPFGKGFLRVNYYQDYSAQNFSYDYKNQQFNRKNAWYRNRKFYSQINYRILSHKYSLGFIHRNSNRGLPSANFHEQSVYGAKTNEQSRRIFFDYKWLVKPEFYLEAILGYNYLNQEFNNSKDPSPFTKYHNDFVNSTYETQVNANFQIKNIFTTKVGMQYFKESLKQKDLIHPSPNTGENSRQTKSIFMGLGYYLPADKMIWKSFKLYSAVRYQKYFTQNAEIYPSLGFSLTPRNIESISISGNWAKSVRYPDFNSLFWKGGVQSQGNPDLMPEKKSGWNAGLTLDFKKEYSPNVYIFYFSEKLTNLIFWEQIRNNHWQPRNLSDAEKEGWDIQIKQNVYFDFISLRVTYSRVNAINKTNKPTIYNKTLVFIPKHTASVSFFSKYEKFNFLISFRYVSERQTVKANTAEPLDEYRIWDASLNYAEQLGKFSIKFELTTENLTGQQYQLLRGYPMPSEVLGASIQVEYKF
jgi:vitamin B12 transporter